MNAAQNYRKLREQIESLCLRLGREPNVMLLPVSKTRPAEAIRELYDLGLRDFGENRVQELLKKKDELPSDIRWHFIGNLQSNKAKYIAPFVHLVHSVHSAGIAVELSKRAKESNRIIPVLIEINISGEEQKHGIAPNNAEARAIQISEGCPNLLLSGLMGMASFEEDPGKTRPQFRMLRELRDQIQERHPELKAFTELSMGMSNDFEVAIEEGATIVRIGSALFGEKI
ncbi:MAG TPA: YggS family pyridoxal phosphate-dependent enzyme [Candidatus Kapabacteria bacterium]|nr:YggS family pyridoxal phosphate-dependent enzyme [Candidatus Kapabacteria bacterium]